MSEIPIFQAPAHLAGELVDFFGKRDCHPLTELTDMRSSLRLHVGVYALYYMGDFRLYECVSTANRDGCHMPIYVGKAVPKGSRTGQVEEENPATPSANLYARLGEHRRSINQAENLDLEHFSFRIAAMEVNLVSWGEGVLIGHLQPLWNQIISGFGIHDPGGGRAEQKRSVWDRLHPGRTAANRLPVADPVDEGAYKTRIDALCGRTRRRLGLP